MILPMLICRGRNAHLAEDNPTTTHHRPNNEIIPPLGEISVPREMTAGSSLRSGSDTIRTHNNEGSSLQKIQTSLHQESAIEDTEMYPQEDDSQSDEDLFEDETESQSASDHPTDSRTTLPHRKTKRKPKKKLNSAERVIQRYRTTHTECHEDSQEQEDHFSQDQLSSAPLPFARQRSNSLDTIALAMNAPEEELGGVDNTSTATVEDKRTQDYQDDTTTDHPHHHRPLHSLLLEDLPIHSTQSPPLQRGIRRCHSDNQLGSRKANIGRVDTKAALAKKFDDGDGKYHARHQLQVMDDMEQGSVQEYILKKKKYDRKKGLFWQEDPTGTTWLHGERHWPRDFATIRGIPIVHKGKRWLMAREVKQYGQEVFHMAPKGAAIPFSYRGIYCLVRKHRPAQ